MIAFFFLTVLLSGKNAALGIGGIINPRLEDAVPCRDVVCDGPGLCLRPQCRRDRYSAQRRREREALASGSGRTHHCSPPVPPEPFGAAAPW